MKELIRKIPLAMSGLMLALAAIGNLVQSYGEIYRNIFGLTSFVLLAALLLKILLYQRESKEELKNPVVASAFPTLTMGIVLLSTYIKPALPSLAFLIWSLAIVGQILIIINFIKNYIVKFNIEKVFPSWFIVSSGIAVVSVTARVFGMEALGKLFFWLALISYFLFLPIVIKRVRSIAIPEAARPSLAIFAAPLALCLAGYMNSFENKNMTLVYALLILSQVSYIFALSQLPKLLKSKFYPSFSGFTFPLVISAISLKLTNGFLINSGQVIPILRYIIKFEEFLALLLVIYILFKYVQFLITPLNFLKRESLEGKEKIV